jgi:hypothetical protein
MKTSLDIFVDSVKAAMKQLQFINSEENEMIAEMYYDFKSVTEVITAIARKRSK